MLHQLTPAAGSRKPAKRVGRGNSSNGGTTAGRGTKGQQARSGAKKRANFEGGQSTLFSRQPKLGGFKNPNHVEYEVINLDTLENDLDAGTYDVAALRKAKVLRTNKPAKLLSRGKVTKKFVLSLDAASAKAKEAIESAGGKIDTVSV